MYESYLGSRIGLRGACILLARSLAGAPRQKYYNTCSENNGFSHPRRAHWTHKHHLSQQTHIGAHIHPMRRGQALVLRRRRLQRPVSAAVTVTAGRQHNKTFKTGRQHLQLQQLQAARWSCSSQNQFRTCTCPRPPPHDISACCCAGV